MCDAKDIMALASTCRMLNTEIERCMLVVDAQHDCYFLQQIPVFFADHCHSSFMTCVSHVYTRMALSSSTKPNYESYHYETVWIEEVGRHDHSDIAFRNYPSQEYKIDIKHGEDRDPNYVVRLRKQFMTSAVTPAMQQALSVCLNMGPEQGDVWYPIGRSRIAAEMTWFFMKLFLLGCGSLSEESSPIRACFESGEKTMQVEDTSICLVPQIINLFEQTLEQKEPMHCVKHTLLAKEMQRDARACTDELPELRLVSEFAWKSSKCKHLDQEDSNRCNDELVFIARIPLAPNTTRISLTANTKTDSPNLLFVIFLQRRQDSLEFIENLIDGKVFHGDGAFRYGRTHFDIEPDHDACFLYFVPGDATKMEMKALDVRLSVVLDEHNEDLRHWMQVLVHGLYCETTSHRLLRIMLLREGALALLGPDQEENTEWKKAFAMIRLDLTPEVLEGIVDVCNVLLEDL